MTSEMCITVLVLVRTGHAGVHVAVVGWTCTRYTRPAMPDIGQTDGIEVLLVVIALLTAPLCGAPLLLQQYHSTGVLCPAIRSSFLPPVHSLRIPCCVRDTPIIIGRVPPFFCPSHLCVFSGFLLQRKFAVRRHLPPLIPRPRCLRLSFCSHWEGSRQLQLTRLWHVV